MNNVPLKRCSKCGTEYPATTDFFPQRSDSKDGLRGQCRDCIHAWRLQYYADHKQEAIEYATQWNQEHPNKRKEYVHRYYETHKEYISEYNRLWWQEHPEMSAEYSRRHYAQDPEKYRIKSRRWHREHKNKANAYARRWYRRNREQRRKYSQRYRKEHKAERAETYRRWARKNPDKLKANNARRRARKAKASGTHSPRDIVLQYESQNGLCWWCGKPVGDSYHIDHRIPLSRGGSDAPSNLVISCPECNHSKYNKMPWEWSNRLL